MHSARHATRHMYTRANLRPASACAELAVASTRLLRVPGGYANRALCPVTCFSLSDGDGRAADAPRSTCWTFENVGSSIVNGAFKVRLFYVRASSRTRCTKKAKFDICSIENKISFELCLTCRMGSQMVLITIHILTICALPGTSG